MMLNLELEQKTMHVADICDCNIVLIKVLDLVVKQHDEKTLLDCLKIDGLKRTW